MVTWKTKLAIGAAILVSVSLLATTLQTTVLFVTNETIHRKLAAWRKGAKYEGIEGVILQTRNMNCGPAALKMALDSLGIEQKLKDIEGATGLDETGTSLLSLMKYAESQGVHAEAWRLNIDDLGDIPLPAIVFIEGDHFAVLDRITQHGEVVLRDPAIGRLRMSKETFGHIWRGETLVMTIK